MNALAVLVRVVWVAIVAAPLQAQARIVSKYWDGGEREITGTVVRADGSPVEGASLVLRTRMARESIARARTTSDLDGRFVLEIEPMPAASIRRASFLDVTAPRFAPSVVDNVHVPPPTYDLGPIVLHEPVVVQGLVTDADGRPVQGAQIHAAIGGVPHAADHGGRSPIAVTDAKGEYRCRVLPPGPVTIGASALGFADRVLEPQHLGADGPNRIDLVLASGAIARLQVLSEGNAPLGDAVAEPVRELEDPRLWKKQRFPRAFWRGAEGADEDGWITLPGLEADHQGEVLVDAPGRRPALARIEGASSAIRLDPVTSIVVTVERAGGGALPEIHHVDVRDGTRAPSFCGNCDENRVAQLWRDSPAVEVLAPDRWHIAWNSRACLVDGGQATKVSVLLTDGTRAGASIGGPFEPGGSVECKVVLAAPASLAGSVRAVEGSPVSLAIGVDLPDLYRSDYWVVVSGADGTFQFDSIGPGERSLSSMDDRWEIVEGGTIELVAGQRVEGVTIRVRPREASTGRAVGCLTIGGAPPGEPVLLSLHQFPSRLPAWPRAFAWTDREGRFDFPAVSSQKYYLLPKHRLAAPEGWRDFEGEFSTHDDDWPFTVVVWEGTKSEVTLDLPPESEWDALAPIPSDD